jgi:FkbM family methyltransferase
MTNLIVQRLLLKTLGNEKYLSLVGNVFLRMYHLGIGKKKYSEMYLLNRLVGEGNTCIDIGANIGYYSVPLAELVCKSGKVFAVEPVELFRNVLLKNLKRYKIENRVEIIPYAFGNTDDQEISMGTPVVDGLVHFGYTKVLSSNEDKLRNTYKVKIHRPQTIFKDLNELHFVKCDIEGYEGKVIPEFFDIIKKFKPSLQIEICPEINRKIIIDLLKPFDYSVFYYLDNKLFELKKIEDNIGNSCDLYFFQPEKINSLRDLIQNQN